VMGAQLRPNAVLRWRAAHLSREKDAAHSAARPTERPPMRGPSCRVPYRAAALVGALARAARRSS
jgi:hypothetical protein